MEKKIKGVFTRDNTYTLLQYVQELENKIKLLNDNVNTLSSKLDELNTDVSEFPPIDTIVTTDKKSIFTSDAYLDIHDVSTIQLTDNMATPGIVTLGIINEHDNSYSEPSLNTFLNPLLYMTISEGDVPIISFHSSNIDINGNLWVSDNIDADGTLNIPEIKLSTDNYDKTTIDDKGIHYYPEKNKSYYLEFYKLIIFMDKFYDDVMRYMYFDDINGYQRFNIDCELGLNDYAYFYGDVYINAPLYIDDTKVNKNYVTKLDTTNLGEDEEGQPCFSMVAKDETTLTPSYTKNDFSIRYLSFGCRDQGTWDSGTPLLNIDANYLEPNLNGVEFGVNNINPDISYFKLSTSFTSTINRVCGRLLVFNSSNILDRAFDLFLIKDGDACKLKLFDSADPSATSYTFPNGTRLVFTLSEMETWHY